MSSLSPLNVGEDVSGFQYTEQNKTLVKKKLVFHASVLFILVVLAVIAALADTQVSLIKNFPLPEITTKTREIFADITSMM